MNLLRKLLFPVVPIYWLVTWVRNKLYDWGIKKSVTYHLPIIAVGNLSVGGTGKTPMVEYLINLLSSSFKLATLSRGYGRNTKGFVLASTTSTTHTIGDEPMQFYTKHEEVQVAVDENRRRGITHLLALKNKPEVILLDDAYQHRKVKAGFYILLTSYDQLYCNDYVLPTGNLREPRSGANRADLVIVTKCPPNLLDQEKQRIEKALQLTTKQQLFFATIAYTSALQSGTLQKPLSFFKDTPFTLITGIANPKPLVAYYEHLGLKFTHINYPDHHNFSTKEIEKLKDAGTLVTTEKDYMRLSDHFSEGDLWYQSIAMQFMGEYSGRLFDEQILNVVKKEGSYVS
ncbi:tetraacyldisaccharide 4'-kinase [Aquimarina brevivitae]|uniref:Tetraacyldisaccharide 4'-kinase n=1 Tax=Aquimarina brevivitae TaxID=323412 RepID=A0A4Q7PI40_9FLAO|nr:tetraacyldisaccharide 4'-kinase [Aquimarina brevivitae]RZT00096.1 lipid-A-disaccharide kinase [Aquimarina brevivitae]